MPFSTKKLLQGEAIPISAGAKEWRESASENLNGFFPMHESWELYEPVGSPGVTPITMPASDQITTAFQNEVEGFIEREISPRVKKLEAEIDPALADRFAYLALRGQEATRAADLEEVKGVVLWDEE